MQYCVYYMQGSSQKIEANIARATDSTGKDIKNVQLQNPVRIIINKSPVLVNYRLYQVGVSIFFMIASHQSNNVSYYPC